MKFKHIGSPAESNKLAGWALFIISSIINLGKSELCKHPITEDGIFALFIRLLFFIYLKCKKILIVCPQISVSFLKNGQMQKKYF